MVNQIKQLPLQLFLREDTPNFKGYRWEMFVRDAVTEIPSIKYEGNPINYYEWLHEHNKTPYDGIVTLPNGSKIHLEMKYREVDKVYHSWFIKDWLPREADFIITNNTDVISYADKRALEAQHKKLMELSEVIVYLGKIIRNILHPSKYLYFNCVLTSLIRVITRLFSNSLDCIKQFFNRLKLFEGKFWQKSNEIMFFGKNWSIEVRTGFVKCEKKPKVIPFNRSLFPELAERLEKLRMGESKY